MEYKIHVDETELPSSVNVVPERGLIAGVIMQAVKDANLKNPSGAEAEWAAVDAVDFLFSGRSDPYFELLDMDPAVERESLLKSIDRFPHYSVFRYRYRKWRAGGKYAKIDYDYLERGGDDCLLCEGEQSESGEP